MAATSFHPFKAPRPRGDCALGPAGARGVWPRRGLQGSTTTPERIDLLYLAPRLFVVESAGVGFVRVAEGDDVDTAAALSVRRVLVVDSARVDWVVVPRVGGVHRCWCV